MMRVIKFVILLSLLFSAAACEPGRGLSSTEGGALGGAAAGAGLGAIVGNQVGSTGAGIAIGSAIGALSGGLIGAGLDAQEEETKATDARIREQDRQLEENRRLLEELKGQGMDVRTTSRGVVVNLPDVLFEFDKSNLTSAARSTVGQIAATVGHAGNRHVSIEGHTDSVGTVAYNQRLSEDRARSVANALTEHGVARRRVSTRGFGENSPIASNSTDSGRARNRRVEVIIENER